MKWDELYERAWTGYRELVTKDELLELKTQFQLGKRMGCCDFLFSV